MAREQKTMHCEVCESKEIHEFHHIDSSRGERWWWQCTNCGTRRDYEEDKTGPSPVGGRYE